MNTSSSSLPSGPPAPEILNVLRMVVEIVQHPLDVHDERAQRHAVLARKGRKHVQRAINLAVAAASGMGGEEAQDILPAETICEDLKQDPVHLAPKRCEGEVVGAQKPACDLTEMRKEGPQRIAVVLNALPNERGAEVPPRHFLPNDLVDFRLSFLIADGADEGQGPHIEWTVLFR
eukprot:334533-Rhodomonas_salina.1